MKKVTITLACLALFALPAAADTVASCDWEDGTSTILGFYGNVANPTNVGAPEPTIDLRSLRVTESPNGGTPQVFLAFIQNLSHGDTIDASFWGHDTTPAASPSMRIWGHWATSGDIDSYNGSAGGNNTYTDGTGWSQVSHSWAYDTTATDGDALVVECRLYSPAAPAEPDFYIDDLDVSVISNTASVTTPCEGPVAIESETWGGMKAQYR
jgi:hypothetical protein